MINKYLKNIVDYYSTLKENNNLISFLKREVKCIDKGLDLLDLSLLPLHQSFIDNSRRIQRENLKKDNFLTESKKLNLEMVASKLKSYVMMSKQERDIYDAFVCFLPIEIESGDLLIEIFVENLICCSIKEKDILNLLHNHFKDIIDGSNVE